MPDDEISREKTLLDHLSAQYRLYREEVRLFLGFAAASVPLLIFLFIGELNAAKDDSRFIVFIPLTSLSYGALLGLMWIYATMAAHYSALLELKINTILGAQIFIFENIYVGPKAKRGEVAPFVALCVLIAAMPVAFACYAMWRLAHDTRVSICIFCGLLVFVTIGFACILWAVYRIAQLRKEMNIQMFDEWQKRWKDVSHSG